VLLATTRVRELIEDKDRTKEIPDAISQGHTTYGMQTFDQSLMFLLKSSLISYEEALRQATNPDDFALRVSGISGTSDSKWDSFEKSADGVAPPAPAPGRAPPAAPPSSRPPGAAASGAALGRLAPQAKGPTRPGGVSPATGDDDFQIERF
jgi:twitching motility protein PilT